MQYDKTHYVKIYGKKDDPNNFAVVYQKAGAELEWISGTVSQLNNNGNFSNAKSMINVREKGCPAGAYLDTKTEKELCFLSYSDCYLRKNTGTDYLEDFKSTKLTTNNTGKTHSTSGAGADVEVDIGEFDGNETCEGFLGKKDDTTAPAYYLHLALLAIRYIAIILALVLSVMDFFKAIFSQDKDQLKKAALSAAKRAIYAVLIFFIPIVLEFILGLLGAYTVKCV